MEKHIALKKAQRRYAKSIIDGLDPSELAGKSAGIVCSIFNSREFKTAENIFAYSAIRGEPELYALFSAAVALGRHVFLPVCEEAGEMFFCDVTAAIAGSNESCLNRGFPVPDMSSPEYVAEFTGKFRSRELFSGKGFNSGAYGTREPDASVFPRAENIPERSVLLCPGLAFDSGGNRLGRGKGFFDKYLSEHRSHFESVCGVCFSELVLPSVAVLPHDAKMDQIFMS